MTGFGLGKSVTDSNLVQLQEQPLVEGAWSSQNRHILQLLH